MKRFVALVAVLLILFSIAPAAYALQQNTTLYATEPVNMRYGPSTKYVVVGALKTGDAVQYLGKSGNWYLISTNGVTAYVYGKYLSTSQPILQPVITQPSGSYATYAMATTNVNVRTGPSTKYAKLGVIGMGQSAPVLGASGNWLQIQWGNQAGYVHKNYFTITSSPVYVAPTTPVYPTYPGNSWSNPNPGGTWYPTYPTGTLPIYEFSSANSAFFSRLDRTGYFTTNANIYMGRFTDSQGIPNIRVANGTDLAKVGSELKALLKDAGTFRLIHSNMPVGVNITYLTYYVSQMNAIYQSLSTWQKSQIPIAGIGYDPALDALVVQLNGMSADKVSMFRQHVSSWAFIQFQNPYYYIP